MRKKIIIALVAGLAVLMFFRWRSKREQPENANTAANVISSAAEETSDSKSADEAKPKAATVPLMTTIPSGSAREEPKPVETPPPVRPLQMRVEKTPDPVSPTPGPIAVPLTKAASEETDRLIRKGDDLLKTGDRLNAWAALSQAYWAGDNRQRAEVLPTLAKLSSGIFWDPRSVQAAIVHVVERGDSLVKMGKKYNVNPYGIQRINELVRPELIKIDQKLKVFPGKPEILISKSAFKLALFVNGRFVKEYGIGQGKDNRTPEGEFELATLLSKPDWYPPAGGIIKYGSPDNLLGTRWLGFKDKPGVTGFGIHGTWEPDSVGKMSSNGCIRLVNKDVEELYDFVLPGTKVVIEP